MAAQGRQRAGFLPEGLADVERGRGFAFQADQVDVLADALADGRCPITGELAFQEGDGVGAVAAGGHDLSADFDGRADGGGEPGVGIELAGGEQRLAASFIVSLAKRSARSYCFAARRLGRASETAAATSELGPDLVSVGAREGFGGRRGRFFR